MYFNAIPTEIIGRVFLDHDSVIHLRDVSGWINWHKSSKWKTESWHDLYIGWLVFSNLIRCQNKALIIKVLYQYKDRKIDQTTIIKYLETDSAVHKILV